MSGVGDGAGTTSQDAGEERAESPISAGAAKRRRMTVSMESVEEKEEEMDAKNSSTSAGTCGWLRSTVGGMPVFGRPTDPVPHLACSRRVTTIWVNCLHKVCQLSPSFFHGR